VTRRLERRQVTTTKGGQFGLSRTRAGVRPNGGSDNFSLFGIGQSKDDNLGDLRMARQQLFHFRWRYLHARTIDHFLQPTADPQVAALVQRAQIASMQPAISIYGRRRSFWYSKVSSTDLIAAHPNLAVFAQVHPIAAFRFCDRKLDVGQRLADRLRAVVNIVIQPRISELSPFQRATFSTLSARSRHARVVARLSSLLMLSRRTGGVGPTPPHAALTSG
jgi:hypothetical protein